MRGEMYDVALRRRSGKEAAVFGCTAVTVGGARVGGGCGVCCRRQVSSDSCALDEDEEASESMYLMSTWERRRAALMVLVRAEGERDLSVDAIAGVVDQTRLAWLFGSGRIAMGPPRDGRKRW